MNSQIAAAALGCCLLLSAGCTEAATAAPAAPATSAPAVPTPIVINAREVIDSLTALGPPSAPVPAPERFTQVWAMLTQNADTTRFLSGGNRVRVGDLLITDPQNMTKISATTVYVVEGGTSTCVRSGPAPVPGATTTPAPRQASCTGTFYVSTATGELVRSWYRAVG